jgi:hypothetical protein
MAVITIGRKKKKQSTCEHCIGSRRSLLSDPKVDRIYYITYKNPKDLNIKTPKQIYQTSRDLTLNVLDIYGKVKYYF